MKPKEQLKRGCYCFWAVFLLLALGAYGIGGVINTSNLLSNGSFRGNWPLSHKSGLILLLACQFALMVGAISTVISMYSPHANLVFFPSSIYFGVIAIGLIVSGSITLNDSTKDMTLEIKDYLAQSKDFKWINATQWENECCGVKSYLDYQELHFSELEQYSVPSSCCIQDPDCGNGLLEPSKTVREIEEVVLLKGCHDYIASEQRKLLVTLGNQMLGAGIFAGIVAGYICWGLLSFGISLFPKKSPNSVENLEIAEMEVEAGGTGDYINTNYSRSQLSIIEIPPRPRRISKKRSQHPRPFIAGTKEFENIDLESLLSTFPPDYEPKIFERPPRYSNNSPIPRSTRRVRPAVIPYEDFSHLSKSSKRPNAQKDYNSNVENLAKPKNSILKSTASRTLGLKYVDSAAALLPPPKIPVFRKAGSESAPGYLLELPIGIPSVHCKIPKRVEFMDAQDKALAELDKLIPPTTSAKSPNVIREKHADSSLKFEGFNSVTKCKPMKATPIQNIPNILKNSDLIDNSQIFTETVLPEPQPGAKTSIQDAKDIVTPGPKIDKSDKGTIGGSADKTNGN